MSRRSGGLLWQSWSYQHLMHFSQLVHFFMLCDQHAEPTCSCGSCGNECDSSQSCCNGVCVDLQTDANNCGQCNFLCNTIPGVQVGVCAAGVYLSALHGRQVASDVGQA